MENEVVHEEDESKPKRQRKKKGKIAQVYKLHQKGESVKDIAEKMNLSERIVRAYIWRSANPEKYKVLLNKYFAKKRHKQENEEIKNIVKKNHQKPAGKEALEK